MFEEKKPQKTLVPLFWFDPVIGLTWKRSIPESGDEFTMYAIGEPDWIHHPISISRGVGGRYYASGDRHHLKAVLCDQRAYTAKVAWGHFSRQFWKKMLTVIGCLDRSSSRTGGDHGRA